MGLGGDSNFEHCNKDKIEYFTWELIKSDPRK